ncbi:TetR/AcrR family transcriptional regulator [Staphylococcus gallinarum]|uniref:TetR/AcrR family transcriptional regulator n=1 Tax=Staphylococcus gallinarum TaxID=1293 RepID=UPI00227F5123|nr:TetR/AcrR family transcriptional regulator [Staphylococcus gallinarum]MDN6413139.1 TetR/AcrR family transcriptional regulator [Staphylococcus gallinarum]
MPTTYTDPRVSRTKSLLMNAFREIAKEKKIHAITVKDITDRATVNRATFYAHFYDKYDIMDYTISETILNNLNETLDIAEKLDESTLHTLFIKITSYIEETHNECKLNSKAYGEVVEKRVKEELEDIFLTLIEDSNPNQDREILASSARFLAWGLYGIAKHWFETSTVSAEDYIKKSLPFLVNHLAY